MLEASVLFVIMWIFLIIVSEAYRSSVFSAKITGALGFAWTGIFLILWAGWLAGLALAVLASILSVVFGGHGCIRVFRQGWKEASLDQLYRPLILVLLNMWILNIILRAWYK